MGWPWTRQREPNRYKTVTLKNCRKIEQWREKHNKAVNDVDEAEIRFDQIETENARLRFQLQEVEAQRDKLIATGKDFDRAEEKFTIEIERMNEKLTQAQLNYD